MKCVPCANQRLLRVCAFLWIVCYVCERRKSLEERARHAPARREVAHKHAGMPRLWAGYDYEESGREQGRVGTTLERCSSTAPGTAGDKFILTYIGCASVCLLHVSIFAVK